MYNPFISGSKVYLRGIEKNDIEHCYCWLNDPLITMWMAYGAFPNSKESLANYYDDAKHSKTNLVLAIVEKETENYVGIIELNNMHPIDRRANISLFIGEREHWGKDYGTEAIALVCSHAFGRLNLNRITAEIVAANEAGVRALLKAGFLKEAVRRQSFFAEGSYHDCIVMGLIKEDYIKDLSESLN